MIKLYFHKAGMQTMVQDMGRNGKQHIGIPKGGWFDRHSALYANRLVGNPDNEALLEITLIGPDIEVEITDSKPVFIAITGADLSVHINENKVPNNQPIAVQNGDRIRFGKWISGCRAYLAVSGKWKIRKWQGSVSPLLVGDTELTPDSLIRKGSCVEIDSIQIGNVSKKMEEWLPNDPLQPIQVMKGPEFGWFTKDQIHYFLNTSWEISPESNRMGYRLRSGLPEFKIKRELISSGIVPGTVQITRAGQPIILMADAQTTGGYPRIANILDEEMDRLAQFRPGDKLRFKMAKGGY